jgi:hypothetical protein
VNDYAKGLRAFFGWAHNVKWKAKNPQMNGLSPFAKIRENKKQPSFLHICI